MEISVVMGVVLCSNYRNSCFNRRGFLCGRGFWQTNPFSCCFLTNRRITLLFPNSEHPIRQLLKQLGRWIGVLCLDPPFHSGWVRLPCSFAQKSQAQLYARLQSRRVCFVFKFQSFLTYNVFSEKADIAPLLDVDDMVATRKPDWKCVFTYVQSIYRRFKDAD